MVSLDAMRHILVFALGSVFLVGSHAMSAPAPPDARGVTAEGHVVRGRYGISPPWGPDIVRLAQPQYPASLRAQHPTGIGWFRLLLDVKTGRVRQVIVEKSSGYPPIDASIIAALQQWRLRPNRWREFDVEVQLSLDDLRPRARKASNQAMQLTAGRSVTNFWDDFHIQPAAELALSQR